MGLTNLVRQLDGCTRAACITCTISGGDFYRDLQECIGRDQIKLGPSASDPAACDGLCDLGTLLEHVQETVKEGDKGYKPLLLLIAGILCAAVLLAIIISVLKKRRLRAQERNVQQDNENFEMDEL